MCVHTLLHRIFAVCVCPSCCIAFSPALSRLHCEYLGNFKIHMSDSGRCLEHLAFETFSKSAGDSESPEALVHDYHSLIYELNRRKKIDGHCKLVTRGVAVNPSGIALAFPHGSDMHIPFSKAILNLVAQDTISNILRSLCFLLMMRQFRASSLAFCILAWFPWQNLEFLLPPVSHEPINLSPFACGTLERYAGMDLILLR